MTRSGELGETRRFHAHGKLQKMELRRRFAGHIVIREGSTREGTRKIQRQIGFVAFTARASRDEFSSGAACLRPLRFSRIVGFSVLFPLVADWLKPSVRAGPGWVGWTSWPAAVRRIQSISSGVLVRSNVLPQRRCSCRRGRPRSSTMWVFVPIAPAPS